MGEKRRYEEIAYWNTRQSPNPEIPELATKRHIQYINDHIGDAESLLDFGPGIGRTFVAYMGIPKVVGCDISTLYYGQAHKAAEKYRLNYEHVVLLTNDLPFYDGEFDVAVACGVLLHQRPQNIRRVMGQLARVAGLIIAISSQENNAAHCFNHDYKRICAEMGWTISDIERKEGQIYFTYAVK